MTKQKPTAKRLSKKDWREIEKLLKKPERNISEISRKYNVSRVNLYKYAWRKGWIEKGRKPKITLGMRIKAFFNPKVSIK
jgi:transposase-like protein